MYVWIKALHVAAVMIWIGGMLASALQIAALRSAPLTHAQLRSIDVGRVWDRRVTTPAMLFSWILGLALAMLGGWFPARWLMLKVVVIVLLSALHGVMAGSLRRIAAQHQAEAPAILRHGAPYIVAALTLVAILVVTKPF